MRGSAPVLPLNIYLVLLALIVLVPALLFSSYLLVRFTGYERKQYEQQMRATAQDLARNLDRDLDGIKIILRTLAVSRFLSKGDLADFHQQANEALAGSGVIMLVLDRNLQQLLNTSEPFGTSLPKSGDPETALRVLETKQPQVSDLFVGRVTGRTAIDVHMPIMWDGEVRYILVMSTTPERVLSVLRAQRLPKGWVLGVSDSKGKVIARSELHERFVNSEIPAELFARRRDPSVIATNNLEGTRVLRTVAQLTQADWVAAATVPMAIIDASTRTSVQVAVVSGILHRGRHRGRLMLILGLTIRTISSPKGSAMMLLTLSGPVVM